MTHSAHHLGQGHGAERRELMVVGVGHCWVAFHRPDMAEH